MSINNVNRRQFVTGALASSALLSLNTSASAPNKKNIPPQTTLQGNSTQLSIGYQTVNFTGAERIATTVNNSFPAPILRWKEGETVTINVKNNLAVDSSIHWHGIILPTGMDGVPGLSFKGIQPGNTFQYQFKLQQNGTYWYHSHSGFQEQTGLFGAIIIDPKEPEPFAYDRDYVVMLSDWSDESPKSIYANLKKEGHIYNTHERTVADLYRDIKNKGIRTTFNDRVMWNDMRMSDRDISDVTGAAYTFLMNGKNPADGWTGLFKKGEKIRLRFINAAAMTFFDVGIPGLKMKVIASDGQYLEPVSVDDFRIGVAETYDVIVEPESDMAYTVFAQAIDRSGYARGTLTPDPSVQAIIPPMDPRPILTHRDMGMAHHQHSTHSQHSTQTSESKMMMDHSHHHHNHHKMHQPKKLSMGAGKAGFGSSHKIIHHKTELGPHVDMRAESPQYQLDDPGIGLRDHQKLYDRRVLTYADLRNLYPTPDPREPSREIQLHLTGNMHRYLWSFNGIPYSKAEPIILKQGERVRVTLVNDTMMNHPIHLHGLWSDLETGNSENIPRKHTIVVQPGAKISYLVSADTIGRWAYHCHLMYHMIGMFREVRVV